jgi:leader peptidase (prepilin peptidase)/N-methyltransferase
MREIAYAFSAALAFGALTWTTFEALRRQRSISHQLQTGLVLVVALAVAVTSVAVGERTSAWLIQAGLALVLVELSVIDVRTRTLPNTLIYPAVAAIVVVQAAVGPDSSVWIGGLVGLAGGLLMYSVGLLPRLLGHGQPGIGLGDVKLAFLLGLVVGWPFITLGLWAGVVLAAIPAAGAIIRRNPEAAFAFGPCLCAGAFVAWTIEFAIR